MKQVLLLLAALIISVQLYAQTKNESALIDSLPYKNNCPKCKPVVYHSSDDKFPFLVTFTGEVIAVSPAAVPCNAICNAGTIALSIITKTPTPPFEYNHDTIFVSIPCFYVQPKDYIGKVVSMTVFKLENFNDDCFQNITNKIDSRGIPFYYTNILKEALIEIESFVRVQKANGNNISTKILKTTFCDKFDKLALEQARWKFIDNGMKDSTYKISLLVNKEEITPDCSGFQKVPQKIKYNSPVEIRAVDPTKGKLHKEVNYYNLIINDYLETYYVDTAAVYTSDAFDSLKIVHQKKDRWKHVYLYFKPEYKKQLQTITENAEGLKLGLFIKGKFISWSQIRGAVKGGVIQFALPHEEVMEYIKKVLPEIKIEEYSK